MSLNSIINTAVTGLQTAQAGLNTVSNNVTNVNTPNYQREVISPSTLVAGGASAGVTAGEVTRVTNQYLQSASLTASASAGSAGVISDLIDQAQAAFGDPTSATSYLNQLQTVFSDFTAAGNNPGSVLARSQAIGDINTFLDSTRQISSTLSTLSGQTDSKITSDLTQVNQLLTQISGLNTTIAAARAMGTDATGAENTQAQLIGTLSSLVGITVQTQSDGSAVVRTDNGALLAGYGGAATLSYASDPTGQGAIFVVPPGQLTALPLDVGNGEIQGLMSLRNKQLPDIQSQLAEYVSSSVSAINAAHNANAAAPPPQTLTGRNTGLDLPTIVGDFTGITNVAVVDSTGHLQSQITIDFSADTISVDGGAATGFTGANFLSALNGALSGNGSASFNNGVLSISATGTSGIAIADDATNPATDAGQGFSQFFGLNDLITSNDFTNYNTGLKLTDDNGFSAGGSITLQVADASGTAVANLNVNIPSGTMQDMVDALNNTVGFYGSFSLDSNGALSYASRTPGATSLSVVSDTTQRGPGGPSLSDLFGIGASQRAGRASTFSVRPDIQSNPMNLALGQLDLSVAASGQPVVGASDSSGAVALSHVGDARTRFSAAGNFAATTTTLTQYAARLGGDLGQRSTTADNANTAAQAVQAEAGSRLSSATGVNLDQELVNLTTYQQAYSASAQLIQAAKEMYNVLLGMVN